MSHSMNLSVKTRVLAIAKTSYLDEVGKHPFPTPSRITESFPNIIIISASTIPGHGVQDTTTTENFALRHGAFFSIQLRLWDRSEAPVPLSTNVIAYVNWVLDDSFVVITDSSAARS